jgi:hypothetical protein
LQSFWEGFIVSSATFVILTRFLIPESGHIDFLMATPPSSQEWDETWQQWRRVNVISVLILAPLAGFASGAFVGLRQKRYAALIAASTEVPELLFHLRSDHAV